MQAALENPGDSVQIFRRRCPHDSSAARDSRALARRLAARARAGGGRAPSPAFAVAHLCLGVATPARPRPAQTDVANPPRTAPRTLRPLGGLWRQRSRSHFEPAVRRATAARTDSSRRLHRASLLLHASRVTRAARSARNSPPLAHSVGL